MAMSACIHHIKSMSVTNQDNGSGVKWTEILMYDVHGNEYEISIFPENQEKDLAIFFGRKNDDLEEAQ